LPGQAKRGNALPVQAGLAIEEEETGMSILWRGRGKKYIGNSDEETAGIP
jgi:hypothetical protein